MAGLPGTGKSTLAARLAAALCGVVLSKDVVRAQLFPPGVLDYSREQDDRTLAVIYARAHRIMCTTGHTVIIDGRTFSRAYQIRDLFAAAEKIGTTPRIIECVCSDELIRERLERDHATGTHPAGNRTFAMYLDVKARAESITVPRLVLDTGTKSLNDCVTEALAFLRANP
jgi:adenylylsulfate kinase